MLNCFVTVFVEELKEGRNIKCEDTLDGDSGGTLCNKNFGREFLLKLGLGTKEFGKEIAMVYYNYEMAKLKAVQCPKCQTFSVRKNNKDQRVRCSKIGCFETDKRDFCYYCGRPWIQNDSQVMCGNPACDGKDPVLLSIQNCELKTISYLKNSIEKVPSMRLCPWCSTSLAHEKNCKFIYHCPRCQKGFCFVCMTKIENGKYCSGAEQMCPKGIAPKQTTYPT